ncbi:MAG TPA: phenylalanine--tRNA ligase subunit beta [Acidimicrobiales bacterium]|nr:phenylalanine--tRNA ligase subunit beta [Acidimicrobiales bacterium]
MRVPLSWLSDFAPFVGHPADLAGALSGLGLAVEKIDRVGEGLEHVGVARVLSTKPHPSADRVQLVEVDNGNGQPLQIVCGAFNFGADDLVALAPIGARLPNGMEIGRRKVRGEWSEGMLCSAAELKLGDDHSGILVLTGSTDAAPGAPLSEALGLRPDVVFDVDVTPNRPDALSMAGVARDLAAKLGVPFVLPAAAALVPAGGAVPKVVVESLDLCPRFTGTLLSDVTVRPSPAWMANRLTLAGMRPINNLVDISNYVMLELGQPNHAYDVARLPAPGLIVRRARSGEVVVTLDRVERVLGQDDCLICDTDDNAIGIAGVMGGASSEIGDDTTDVLLEAAYFSPVAVARASKSVGLRTEASVRFERGVDPEGIDRAVARFCALASEVAGASPAGDTTDVRGEIPLPPRVTVRTDRVNAILGTSLRPEQVAAYLEPIGFDCEAAEAQFEVQIPSWRPDCEREIDVIEEVARHHGYPNIPRTVPATASVGGLTALQRDRRHVRQILAGAGISEAWSTSFLSFDDLARAGLATDALEVENPLTSDESVLRTSILPGLLRALVTNQSHRHPDVSLFEIGHVFRPPEPGAELPIEPENLAVVLGGRSAPEAKLTWDLLVGALPVEQVELVADSPPGLHPTRSARIVVGGLDLGVMGEVDPAVLDAHDLAGPVAWFEVDLGALLKAPRRPPAYLAVSRFPSADIDLAFAVPDEVPAGKVEAALRIGGGEELEGVWLFDVFRGAQIGEGRRNLAYRLRFAALDHTLAEGELARLRDRSIAAVVESLPAELRA